jgi:ATP-binding cassette, subfamily B, bacterial CvaB/MchF/RaxB
LHAERISDIALTAPEENTDGVYRGPEPEPSIKLKNISFRYAESEPWIFRNLSLTIHAGESVAIVGPSGCGKSTLAKIILGLLKPDEGSIEVGNVAVESYGLYNYRKIVGAVMQDDTLFAGSIADNISFFDDQTTLQQVTEAATHAQIHNEISVMTMAYETLVGDMGSALSGGQVQRVLLARALYRKPKILVLDEATSHLDVKNEVAISKTVKSMKITRVVIAHRQETIASADRIIEIDDPYDQSKVLDQSKAHSV